MWSAEAPTTTRAARVLPETENARLRRGFGRRTPNINNACMGTEVGIIEGHGEAPRAIARFGGFMFGQDCAGTGRSSVAGIGPSRLYPIHSRSVARLGLRLLLLERTQFPAHERDVAAGRGAGLSGF